MASSSNYNNEIGIVDLTEESPLPQSRKRVIIDLTKEEEEPPRKRMPTYDEKYPSVIDLTGDTTDDEQSDDDDDDEEEEKSMAVEAPVAPVEAPVEAPVAPVEAPVAPVEVPGLDILAEVAELDALLIAVDVSIDFGDFDEYDAFSKLVNEFAKDHTDPDDNNDNHSFK
jgi:hypothetical protein